MSGQEKKRQRIYDLIDAETKPKFLCLPKQRKSLQKKSFLRKSGCGGLNKKWKEGFFFNCSPTTSIRKHANELKVHEKIVWTAIKQNFSLGYTKRGVLENKTNTTSHPNMG